MSLQFHLGELLKLPHYHHFYHLPVHFPTSNHHQSLDRLLIAFLEDGQVSFVALDQERGLTSALAKANSFKQKDVLAGLSAVPLSKLSSVELFALAPKDQPSVRRLHQLYPNVKLLEPLFLANPQHLTDDYDPYRYTRTADKTKTGLPTTSEGRSDINYDQALQAFSRRRTGEPAELAMIYTDPKSQQQVKIFVRGWYFLNGKPPLQLSWQPTHTRKSPYRSSHIFIDKTSKAFFFQGEIYKQKQAPVFIKDLKFSSKPSAKVEQNWLNFLQKMEALDYKGLIELKSLS